MSSTKTDFKEYVQRLRNLRNKKGHSSWSDLLKQLRKFSFSDYFIGFLLMPWIWVWGYLFLSAVLLGALTFTSTDPSTNFFLTQTFSSRISIFQLWQLVLVFTFFNYTVSFITRYKIPKLQTLLFLLSLFQLLIFGLALWPYFGYLF